MRTNNLKATIVGLALLAMSGLASAGVISSTGGTTITAPGFGLINDFNSAAADAFWTATNIAAMSATGAGKLGATMQITGGGLVEYTYLGKEAAYTNFFFNASGTNTPIDDTEAFGTTSRQMYGNTFLQNLVFNFTTTGSGAGSVANGSVSASPQFATFNGLGGYAYILAYNDRGGDFDFDDMLIGVRALSGPGGDIPDPVPEPASLALLGLGLAGLGYLRRRKAV